ncbi:UDP-N-acetylglucosamine--LPS N-acetylglucosamine transferase [Sphingomonas sp. dw_22]|uniref:UDP-N-acetylglucosamine--LPS N-acetylglucosamine transferase n=1 Tax=Sphingomonas sp. dw_22 TaxID=2721175 RepID=UPI001BD1ECE7|nr:UDP-N-acetylglucosamine--LPS N-acetylglucosamine transferase [Sphingomonas sp. dw_22]
MAKPRLLALASGGGHWIQLLRLRPAFEDFDTAYVSMFESYADMLDGARFYTVPDASRFDLKSFVPVFLKAIRILARERPRVIVTTGSAPMLAFILLGRLTFRRTLWIDSIANSERMSSSGRLARRLAHKVISQWPDVAEREGVESWGRVI